jgi:hypothetical protein
MLSQIEPDFAIEEVSVIVISVLHCDSWYALPNRNNGYKILEPKVCFTLTSWFYSPIPVLHYNCYSDIHPHRAEERQTEGRQERDMRHLYLAGTLWKLPVEYR